MKTLIILLCLTFSNFAYSMFFEIDADFRYSKDIYGKDRQNSIVSRSYSVGFSSYVFSTTAIDINYSYGQDTTSNNDKYNITGYTVDHIADQSRVETAVYGIGIKQMLAPKTSFLVPIISVGYAREFITSSDDTTYLNTATSTKFYYISPTSKTVVNSVFGSFMLQMRMTEALSFKASIKTIFPAFKFNKAKDSLKYSVGFSWLF